jgi:hypothetical protein
MISYTELDEQWGQVNMTKYSPANGGRLAENYAQHMDAFQFIKDVPVDWDDTKVLEAEPGDYITYARNAKGSDNWFVGRTNDEEPRESRIKLDFLDPSKTYLARIYADAPGANFKSNPLAYVVIEKRVTSKSTLDQFCAPGGGYAISIMAQN